MHNEYKRQSPYRGFWVILLLLIVPPLVCFGIVDAVLDAYSKWPQALDDASAKALGCWLGFLVNMICLLSGLLTEWRSGGGQICGSGCFHNISSWEPDNCIIFTGFL